MKIDSKILKEKNELGGIELLFGKFSEYDERMEEYLKKSSSEKAAQISDHEAIEKEAEKAGEHSREFAMYLQDSLIEQWVDFDKWHPHFFRVSFLTFITSFVEYELYAICNDYFVRHQPDYSVSDLKENSDLEKLKKYLSKTVKIDFQKLLPEWSTIRTFWKIRNLFVHHNGFITETYQYWSEIELFVKTNNSFVSFDPIIKSLKSEKNNYALIIKEKGFNQMLLEKVRIFFLKLVKELDERERIIEQNDTTQQSQKQP
jgi:hypothetical protein